MEAYEKTMSFQAIYYNLSSGSRGIDEKFSTFDFRVAQWYYGWYCSSRMSIEIWLGNLIWNKMDGRLFAIKSDKQFTIKHY